MLAKEIKNNKWVKNWSGNWGLIFGSFYGQIYTTGLERLAGKHFSHNLIVFEKGISANYLVQDELRDYCNYLVSLIQKDEQLTRRWTRQVIENTDKIFEVIKSLKKKKNFSQKDFFDFLQFRLEITTANFSIKKVIDYLPPNLVEKNLELFTKVRLYTEPVYNQSDELEKVMACSLTGHKLSEVSVSVVTVNELKEFFHKNKLPSKKILEERFLGCALVYDKNGKEKIFQGKAFRELNAFLTKQFAQKQIKGMIAYPGKVQGKVRVVLDPAKCKDFAERSILVAGMTRPEYLSLMKKSAAFITDAGGLLSHASIVARELKKPCIVGTEIATKILKDGDWVEVDANRGIVVKIK
ncbi:MAG: PEP-utilizing enzyme [Candidatus Buchananbacteria bacterium]